MTDDINEELAKNIYENKDFRDNYLELISIEFSGGDKKLFTIDKIKKIIESASIFATTDDENYKNLTYIICILLMNNFIEEMEGLNKIIQNILLRLGNFPAVEMMLRQKKEDVYSIRSSEEEHRLNPIKDFKIITKKQFNRVNFVKDDEYFTDFQRDVFNHLLSGKSISYSAPTSAGKSFLMNRYLAKKALSDKFLTAVYIVPTRALISQVQHELISYFKKIDVKDVDIYTSSNQLEADMDFSKKKIFILTQERLSILLNEYADRIKVDILIVDEAHKIGNGDRGVLLESAIESLLHQYPDIQSIFLSPLTKNPEKFKEIFNLPEAIIEKTYVSPVSQNLFYVNIIKDKASIFLGSKELRGKHFLETISIEEDISSSELKKIWMIKYFSKLSSSSIIYCNKPDDSQMIARMLYDSHVTKNGEEEVDEEILESIGFLRENIHPDYFLIDYLKSGIAYHHGKMPPIARSIVENLVKKGKVKYICCTSTLLEGVNLPAKNIFLYKPKKNKTFDAMDFWNLAGRAGRLLKDFYGNIYCLNVEEWEDYKPEVTEPFENIIESAFEETLIDRPKDIIKYLEDYYKNVLGKKTVEPIVTRFILKELQRGNEEFIKSLISRNNQIGEIPHERIAEEVKRICGEIYLPYDLLNKNPFFDPRRQQKLYEEIKKDHSIYPISPYSPGKEFFKSTKEVFNKALMGLDNKEPYSSGFLNVLISTCVSWVWGSSIKDMVQNRIDYKEKYGKLDRFEKNKIIDMSLDSLEKWVRYKIHNYIKCYTDIYEFYCEENSLELPKNFSKNIPLFIEQGSCSQVVLMLQNIGFSRSTALEINSKFNIKVKNVMELKRWLNINNHNLKTTLSIYSYKDIINSMLLSK